MCGCRWSSREAVSAGGGGSDLFKSGGENLANLASSMECVASALTSRSENFAASPPAEVLLASNDLGAPALEVVRLFVSGNVSFRRLLPGFLLLVMDFRGASENRRPFSAGVSPAVVGGVENVVVVTVSRGELSDGVAVSLSRLAKLCATGRTGSGLCSRFAFVCRAVLPSSIWVARYLRGSSDISSECGTLASTRAQARFSSSSSCSVKACLSIRGESGMK